MVSVETYDVNSGAWELVMNFDEIKDGIAKYDWLMNDPCAVTGLRLRDEYGRTVRLCHK